MTCCCRTLQKNSLLELKSFPKKIADLSQHGTHLQLVSKKRCSACQQRGRKPAKLDALLLLSPHSSRLCRAGPAPCNNTCQILHASAHLHMYRLQVISVTITDKCYFINLIYQFVLRAFCCSQTAVQGKPNPIK